MRVKTIAIAIGVALLICYLIAFSGEVLPFIVYFPVAAFGFIIGGGLAVVLFFRVAKRLLRRGRDIKPSAKNAGKVKIVELIIGCLVFVVILSACMKTFISHPELTGIKTPEHSNIKALQSLPYIDWVDTGASEGKVGVTKYEVGQTYDGLNLYCTRATREAYLMDMSGKVLQTWKSKKKGWHHVKLSSGGDLLAGVYNGILQKVDKNSNVLWSRHMRFHHEISVADNSDIYVLDRKEEVVFLFGLPVPIVNDYVVVINATGEDTSETDLFEVFKNDIPFDKVVMIYKHLMNFRKTWESVKRYRWRGRATPPNTPLDIMHHNTVTIAERKIEGVCEKGDLLLSARELDLIAILADQSKKLIWKWGVGELSRQHQPTFLENGNILIFDNGRARGYSRVLEVDPRTDIIVWKYESNPHDWFYSAIGGGCERLANGNTLITEEYKGHVFEITKTGKVVWEFYCPEVDVEDKKRASIYRLSRIAGTDSFDW